ncbi:MAG: hypothetical protein HKO66_15495 [Saprospiraceae bacterium]|nr:hypothetical protein [Saprospiraceae bacterium]
MKTSNKLLLSGFILLFLTFVSFLLYGKKFITKGEIDHIQGNGIKGELILKENFDSDTLYITDSRDYYLDPTTNYVKVIGEENVIPIFEARNYRGLNIKRNDYSGLSTSMEIKFIIGVKDKNNLTIIVKDDAYVKSTDQLNIETLNLEASDRSEVIIDNIGKTINVRAKYKTFLDITGDYETANILGLGEFTFDAVDVSFDTLNLDLESRSYIKVKDAKVVKGVLQDNAKLRSVDSLVLDQVKFYDNANHKIIEWD